jgi:beta-lactamase class A
MLMTIISDNTATDMLMLRLGIDAINGYMHSLGLTDIHVARTLNDIFADMLPSNDPTQDLAALAVWEAENGVRRDGFSYSLGADNNVSTPRHMTRLVEMIFKAEILDRAACDGILDIMHKQHFNDRIPRFLPPGTRVAHKTGTFEGVRNDSGIIYVNEHSHIALTTLSTWDSAPYRMKPIEDWQHVIAIDSAIGSIGLAAFEAFK